MHCIICDRECVVACKGVCTNCRNPVKACKKCQTGEYQSASQPDWMNRYVCNKCGHEASR